MTGAAKDRRPPPPHHTAALRSLLSRDQERSRILRLVYALRLPDCWIGAGFVRNAVWDYLHGLPPSKPKGDVDVIWFDPAVARPAADTALEAKLRILEPDVHWSVKNQIRMHARNNDAPYTSASDAIRFWPETATAVAVRYTEQGTIDIAAPFGLDDLFDLIIRPTPRFSEAKRQLHLDRIKTKQWLLTWPRLKMADPCDQSNSVANPGSRQCANIRLI